MRNGSFSRQTVNLVEFVLVGIVSRSTFSSDRRKGQRCRTPPPKTATRYCPAFSCFIRQLSSKFAPQYQVSALACPLPGICASSAGCSQGAACAMPADRLCESFELQNLLAEPLCRYLAVLLFNFYADGAAP